MLFIVAGSLIRNQGTSKNLYLRKASRNSVKTLVVTHWFLKYTIKKTGNLWEPA
jgi:hypothetical protein